MKVGVDEKRFGRGANIQSHCREDWLKLLIWVSVEEMVCGLLVVSLWSGYLKVCE